MDGTWETCPSSGHTEDTGGSLPRPGIQKGFPEWALPGGEGRLFCRAEVARSRPWPRGDVGRLGCADLLLSGSGDICQPIRNYGPS